MRQGTKVGIGAVIAGAMRDVSEEMGRVEEGELRALAQSPAPHETTSGGCFAQSYAEAHDQGPETDWPDVIGATETHSLPDTGGRSEFTTGAVRDASVGKGHFRSIPPDMLRRLAKRFEDGAEKYQDGNWLKGIPLKAYYDSMFRHLLAWAEGQHDEDHLAAVVWNAVAAGETERRVMEDQLPANLDDLPYRLTTVVG